MKQVYPIILTTLLVFTGFSQDIHRLKAALKKAESDTAKANILHKLALTAPEGEWEKYNNQLKHLSQSHLKKTSPREESVFFQKQLAFTFNRSGNICLAQGNFDGAYQLHQRAQKMAQKINDLAGIGDSHIGFGNIQYFEGDLEKAMEHYLKALKTYRTSQNKEGIATALSRIGIIYNELGDNTKALSYYRKSLALQEETGNQLGIAQCLNNIGLLYHNQGNIPKALDYYRKSLTIKEKIGNKTGIASSLNSIGVIYFDQHDWTNALAFFKKGLKIREEMGNKEGIAASLGNIGVIYHEQGNIPKALEYFRKALKMDEEIGDQAGIAASLNNLGDIYKKMGKMDWALDHHNKALVIQERINEKEGITASLINIGEIYREQKKYDLARKCGERGLALAKEIGHFEPVRDAAHSLYQTYKQLGETEDALANFELYIQMRDSVNNEENQQVATELKYRYEYEKKTAEDRVRDAEEKKVISARFKQEQTQRYTLYGGLTLVTLFGGFMFNRFRVTSRQKKVIENQEKETNRQKHLIEEKQQEILDSISYAKRLQDAILPPLSFIDSCIPENFVLYRPKDIVAGDFYWAESLNDLFFIAAADSTGHGVPGAMVSVVCSNALNRSVKEFGLTEPGNILGKTRELVIETFAKNNSEVKDGMDISLLCIDHSNHQVAWSGANNPLWYIQEGELIEIKADKQPIGKTEQVRPFTTHAIDLKKGTIFYLFTDGFADQFGGPKGKKFKNSQMKELLLQISSKSIKEQGKEMENHFDRWKGELEQVDDVCVIGFCVD